MNDNNGSGKDGGTAPEQSKNVPSCVPSPETLCWACGKPVLFRHCINNKLFVCREHSCPKCLEVL